MIERHPIAFYAHGCYVTSMSKKGRQTDWYCGGGGGESIMVALYRKATTDYPRVDHLTLFEDKYNL